MQIILNEYTLALLCGGISCLTFFLSQSFMPSGKTVRIKDDRKRKSRKPILKATNSETNDSVDEEDEVDSDDQSEPPSEKSGSRRQSFTRAKPRRSDSVKSDHVIFADEITEDDEKFSPIHDDIPSELIEGILSKSEEEVPNTVNLNQIDVEELNRFEEIHPLDDHDLLIRRRSLHSTPSGSHRGSRTNLAPDHDEDGQSLDVASADHKLRAELSACKEKMNALEIELTDMEIAFAKEKHDIEEILENAGLDKTDLSGSVKELNILLQSALNRINPDFAKTSSVDEALLGKYLANRTHQ